MPPIKSLPNPPNILLPIEPKFKLPPRLENDPSDALLISAPANALFIKLELTPGILELMLLLTELTTADVKLLFNDAPKLNAILES